MELLLWQLSRRKRAETHNEKCVCVLTSRKAIFSRRRNCETLFVVSTIETYADVENQRYICSLDIRLDFLTLVAMMMFIYASAVITRRYAYLLFRAG